VLLLLFFGEVRFLELALERVFGVLDVEVADQLLGDRRGALNGLAAGEDVLPDRAGDAGVVEGAVLEEVLVLDRHRGVTQRLGHRAFAHWLTDVFGLDEADQAAVGGVDRRRATLLHRLEAGKRRRRLVDVDRPAGGDAARDREGDGEDPEGDQHLFQLRGMRPASSPSRPARHSAANCTGDARLDRR
jgi:hypothetical protein